MKSLSIMIKPASGNCNMRCKYCFYADVADNREIHSYGQIDMETTENIIKKAYDYVDTSVTFAFQVVNRYLEDWTTLRNSQTCK